MRVGARRWTLKHESRAYGSQQARNLRNGLTPDEGTRSARALHGLLPSVNGRARKGWVRRVPATAVIPAPQVVVTVIGSKASVAGLVSLE